MRLTRPRLFLTFVFAGLSLGPALAAADAASNRAGGGAWWDTEGGGCCSMHWLPAPAAPRIRADYDESTGRSLLNYPKHRFADHIHMKLEIRIPDMNTPRFEATETLTLAPIGMELPEITLDCGPSPSMEFGSVQLIGGAAGGTEARRVTYTHEGEELRIAFDPPIPEGERFDVAITYTLTDPPEGLTWTPESPAWPGRPAQLHTQGQPESNRYWFPCHDFPNERLSTEIIATVPAGYTVISNGKLVGKSSSGGQETFHWLQSKEHVNYLVTLVVGKFDVVDVGNSKLPMPVYVPPGQGRNVEQTYGRTLTMVRKFETILDEPYPWDKYAQIIVHNFSAGGMENTSATSMYDTAVLDRTALLDGDLDGLISHELAHQWFGDLMTCNSWEHIWLNEGFATFFSHVWFEERDGIDAYLTGMYGTFKNVCANDRAEAPFVPGMCSKEYTHPWDAFRRGANPYPKGAGILHMLRVQLGDKLFVEGLREYVERVKGKNVETDDLRYAFEAVSGLSLDRFFRQWCKRPGVPRLDVNLDWDSSASQLRVGLTQTQNIDGYNPAFFFTLPIWVQTRGGPREGEWLEVRMDSRQTEKTFDLRGEPIVVAVNANLALLADIKVNQPEERWLAQLERGPTVAAKMQAIDALRDIAGSREAPLGDDAARALSSLIRSGSAHHALRRMAAEAIMEVGGADAYLRAFDRMPGDARVRDGLVSRAAEVYASIASRGDTTPARFLDELRRLAKRDESYGVRSTAIRQLGRIGGSEARSVIMESIDAPSQHDQIRRACLNALADLDEPEGLSVVLKYTAENYPSRTRPEAISAAARLAHHNPDLATNVIAPLLRDRTGRTTRGAGDALLAIGGPAAEQAIRAYAAEARGAIARAMAADWLRRLDEAKAGQARAGAGSTR